MRVERGTQQAAAWNNTDKRVPPPLGLLRAVGALRLGGHAVAEVGVDGAPAVDAQAGVVVKHAQVLEVEGRGGGAVRVSVRLGSREAELGRRRSCRRCCPAEQAPLPKLLDQLPGGLICRAVTGMRATPPPQPCRARAPHVGQGVERALLADEAGRVANLHGRLRLGHIHLRGGAGRQEDWLSDEDHSSGSVFMGMRGALGI